MDNVEKVAVETAIEAGRILKSFWGKLSSIKQKEYFWDLVTEADLASEEYILKSFATHFPTHQILSEEAGLNTQDSSIFQWYVDPLDGTTNFTHQYPMVAVSIGLLVNHVPTLGVVYNPIFDELFVAVKGKGATLNQKPIQVSSVTSLDRSLLATGFAYDRKETKENNYSEFCHMTHHSQGVRRGGAASIDLAYVAAGRLDGYWERGLKPWDMAAGIVLVQEAGGKISSYENGPLDIHSGRILATNGKIHDLISKELQEVKKNNQSIGF